MYPDTINLASATTDEMASAFHGWPLPQENLEDATTEGLSDIERKWLWDMYQNIGMDADKLPYTPELDRIQVGLAECHLKYMAKQDIQRTLVRMRKQGKKNNI